MVLVALVLGILAGSAPQHTTDWRSPEPGIEFRWLMASNPSQVGDSRIAVVRIDPTKWELLLVARSQTGDSTGKTAREWAKGHGLAAAINAGMFGSDYKTHVGYMESRGHVNSSTVNEYQSVAAFDPRNREKGLPFRIFDLDEQGITVQAIRLQYSSLVQNLRLIRKPGRTAGVSRRRNGAKRLWGRTRGEEFCSYSPAPRSR